MSRILWGIAASLMVATATPADAQTAIRFAEGDTGTIDPHRATVIADQILSFNLYDPLVFPALDGKSTAMKPHLAESIAIDPSGLVYTAKLRRDVKFHSGNPMTADDVVYSMNRMLALKTGNSFLFDGWIKSSVAKDPHTVAFTVERPYAAFSTALVRLAIVDSKTLIANKQPGNHGEFGDYGVAWLNSNAAGTGAYQAVSHKADERTEMKKFPDYFLGVPAKAPDIVRMYYGQKDAAVVARFSRGELDIISSFATAETKRQVLAMPGTSAVKEPGVANFFMKPNHTKPPFDDLHCRRAFAYALDYDAMLSIERIAPGVEGAIYAKGPMPSSHPGFDPTMPDIKRDMAKARAELAQCKHKPGSHRILITWITAVPKEQRIALIAQQNWKELGFESDIESRVWANWTQQAAKPETTPTIGQVYTFARIPDPDSYLFNIFHSSRHGQFSASEYFADKEIDQMLEQGRSMNPGPEREQLYRKVMHRLEDLKATFTGYESMNTYVKRNNFSWPNLEQPNMNTGMIGGNHIFRLMEMKTGG